MLELGLPLVTMITANAIMSIASALQASVGSGLALLAVPLLVLLDPRLVPWPMLLAGSLLGRSPHAILYIGNEKQDGEGANRASLSALLLARGHTPHA